MTNQELLEKKINESGKKKGYLAKKCGLEVTTIPAPSPKKLLLKNYAREFICFAEFLKR